MPASKVDRRTAFSEVENMDIIARCVCSRPLRSPFVAGSMLPTSWALMRVFSRACSVRGDPASPALPNSG